MVCRFSFSYFSNHSRFLLSTRLRISSTCCRCFANALARKPINSAVDKTRSGISTNHVASWISKGKIGCAPVVIKNGEHPKYFLISDKYQVSRLKVQVFNGVPIFFFILQQPFSLSFIYVPTHIFYMLPMFGS